MFLTLYISIWLYSWTTLYINRDDAGVRTTTGVYIWTQITILMTVTGPVGVIVSIVHLMLKGAN
jgi:hypothetical protein